MGKASSRGMEEKKEAARRDVSETAAPVSSVEAAEQQPQPQQQPAAAAAAAAAVAAAEYEYVYALVGKTGHGKSRTANSLSQTDKFGVGDDFDSCTAEVASHQYTDSSTTKFCCIDTPGVFDTKLELHELCVRISKFTYVTPSGLDALVCVVRNGRFSSEEIQSLEHIEKIFGEKAWKHAVFVFTHCGQRSADELKQKIVKMEGPNGDLLRKVVEKAGWRVARVENEASDDQREQDRRRIHELIVETRRIAGEKYDNTCFYHAREKLLEVRKLRAGYEDQIESLNEERRQGLLSEEEFQRRKNELDEKIKDHDSNKKQIELKYLAESYARSEMLKEWGGKAGILLAGCASVALTVTAVAAAAPGLMVAGTAMMYAGAGIGASGLGIAGFACAQTEAAQRAAATAAAGAAAAAAAAAAAEEAAARRAIAQQRLLEEERRAQSGPHPDCSIS